MVARCVRAASPFRPIVMRFAILLAILSSFPAHADRCMARSGPHTAALVELYTSEGCSSCPPADRWLAGLRAQGYGPERVVPLALHVDYWDYIGWKDPYAKREFSLRQRKLTQLQRMALVYTPQVMLQGRDFRPWSGPAFDEAVSRINARPAAAASGLHRIQRVQPNRGAGPALQDQIAGTVDIMVDGSMRYSMQAAEHMARFLAELKKGNGCAEPLHPVGPVRAPVRCPSSVTAPRAGPPSVIRRSGRARSRPTAAAAVRGRAPARADTAAAPRAPAAKGLVTSPEDVRSRGTPVVEEERTQARGTQAR